MSIYTFEVQAAVSIEATNEKEARSKYWASAAQQDTDVDYNGLGVYLPSWGMLTLTDVEHDDEEN